MLNTIRRRLTREEGVSLVETLVGMVILGIVLAGLMSTIVTAFAAVHSQEHRLRAQQLGNEVIEELRALPWGSVGISDTDPDYVDQPQFDGQTWQTVALDASVSQVDPVRETVRDGKTYTVVTDVVWSDDTSGPTTINRAHKRFRVQVSWTIRGVTRTARTDGLRARTAAQTNPDDFTVTLNIAPAEFEVNEFGLTTQPALIATAVTSHPAGTLPPPRLRYSPVNGAVPLTLTMVPVGGTTQWTVSIPVAAHVWDPPGGRVFRVEAFRASDARRAVDHFNVLVTHPFSVALDAPLLVQLAADGTNAVAIPFAATTSLPATEAHLYLETAGGEVGPIDMVANIAGDPNHPNWEYTVPAGAYQWADGIRTMRVESRWAEDPGEDYVSGTAVVTFLPFIINLPPLL